MKIRTGLFLLAAFLPFTTKAFAADPNFYIFLCFGQSNMDGAGKIEEQDKTVDERFQVLAAIDAPRQDRKRGAWYPAVPPLCRGTGGLSPADYFGRTMVANLPKNVRVGVINVAVPGCKIELFEKDTFKEYVKTAPAWMTSFIKGYDGDPYQHLLSMAKLAQKDGVIKGILLHQGESNPNDHEWTMKVKGIYDNLIKDLDLKADQVPLLAGETVNADQKGVCAGMNKIIAELPTALPILTSFLRPVALANQTICILIQRAIGNSASDMLRRCSPCCLVRNPQRLLNSRRYFGTFRPSYGFSFSASSTIAA